MSLSDLRELDLSYELCRMQDKIAKLTIERDGWRAVLVLIASDNFQIEHARDVARRALATDGE